MNLNRGRALVLALGFAALVAGPATAFEPGQSECIAPVAAAA